MDFIKNLKISDDHDNNTQQPPQPVTETKPKKEGLFDKLSDALKGEDDTPPPPPPAPAKSESLFDKIGDALSGRKTPPPPPPAPAKSENLFDKIGDALSGRKTPPPAAPEKTDVFSKLTSTLTGKKEEPPKPQSLGDKINHALGGGAAGEAKEGKLDKAIDLFQEHVLKEGPQHNESALEQLKDKHISDTIRNVLGLPESDKKNKN